MSFISFIYSYSHSQQLLMIRRSFLFCLSLFASKYLTEYLLGIFNGKTKGVQIASAEISKYQQKQLPSNPIIDVQPTPPPVIEPPATSPTTTNTPVPKPIEFVKKTIKGTPLYQTTINLQDSEQLLTIGLANQASQANNHITSVGDEDFAQMVKRHQAAVVINGTFFSKDEEKRVLGNMVAEGKFLKYSRWENYGTTLGIKAGNQLEMVTARTEGQPNWQEHWFSLTCGPRLLKDGQIWLNPTSEGFKDPHVFDRGWRTAIGYPPSGTEIYLVTFDAILSLEEEAELMKALGCSEAMNLDGGASRALAHRSQIIVPAGRKLTNVLVVYDLLNQAPENLKSSWHRFQQGERPIIPS